MLMSPKSWTVLSNSTTSPTWRPPSVLSSGTTAMVGFSVVWPNSCKALFTSALLALRQLQAASRMAVQYNTCFIMGQSYKSIV